MVKPVTKFRSYSTDQLEQMWKCDQIAPEDIQEFIQELFNRKQ